MAINTVTSDARAEILAMVPDISSKDLKILAAYIVGTWFQNKRQHTSRLPENVRETLSFWGVI